MDKIDDIGYSYADLSLLHQLQWCTEKNLKCAIDKNDCFLCFFWGGESVSGIRFYPYDLDFPVPEVAIFPL